MNSTQHTVQQDSYRGREHAVPCQVCGMRRGRPVTMTWNPSALCDRHEVADEAAHLREQAIDGLVEGGYGRQVAVQIVDRMAADVDAFGRALYRQLGIPYAAEDAGIPQPRTATPDRRWLR